MQKSSPASNPLLDLSAAFYARHSSRKQNRLSAEEQIERGLAMVERGEIRLIKYPLANYQLRFAPEWLVKDEAQSAKTTARRGYERILEGIRKGSFKTLIVDDLSRVCRELGSQMQLYQLLKFHGVELYSICDGVSSEDPDAYTIFAIKGIVNDSGNKAHAMRTKRGMEMRAMKGCSTGDLCFGFSSTASDQRIGPGGAMVGSYYKVAINPVEAVVVRLIFDLKLGLSKHPMAGATPMGPAGIAKLLNQTEVPSSIRGLKITGKVSNWSPSTIHHMLRNEKYIGIWRWNKSTWLIDPDSQKRVSRSLESSKWVAHKLDAAGHAVEQQLDGNRVRDDLTIVSLAKWDAVQASMKMEEKRLREKQEIQGTKQVGRPAGSGQDTLLSGILTCGKCGGLMYQVSGTKGGFFGCYVHHRKNTEACKNNRLIGRRRLEPRIAELVRSVLLDPKVLSESVQRINQAIKRRWSQAPDELQRLERQEAELLRMVKNLLSITLSASTSEALEETGKVLQSKEEELRTVREKLQAIRAASGTVEKLLVTTFALKARYESLLKYFEKDVPRANAALRILFPMGLACDPHSTSERRRCNRFDNHWTIKGAMVVGGAVRPDPGSLVPGDQHPVELKV